MLFRIEQAIYNKRHQILLRYLSPIKIKPCITTQKKNIALKTKLRIRQLKEGENERDLREIRKIQERVKEQEAWRSIKKKERIREEKERLKQIQERTKEIKRFKKRSHHRSRESIDTKKKTDQDYFERTGSQSRITKRGRNRGIRDQELTDRDEKRSWGSVLEDDKNGATEETDKLRLVDDAIIDLRHCSSLLPSISVRER